MNILCLGISYPMQKFKGSKKILKEAKKNSTFYLGNNDSNDIDLLIRNNEGRNKWNNIIKVNN